VRDESLGDCGVEMWLSRDAVELDSRGVRMVFRIFATIETAARQTPAYQVERRLWDQSWVL
tara:strand:+ start:682 stop:864 length:183 start_codon:yes stop_codon:yes gene_type:complete